MTDEEAHAVHNRIVPEICTRIVTENPEEADCWVVLESIIVGVMLYHQRTDPAHVALFADALMTRVIDRMDELRVGIPQAN